MREYFLPAFTGEQAWAIREKRRHDAGHIQRGNQAHAAAGNRRLGCRKRAGMVRFRLLRLFRAGDRQGVLPRQPSPDPYLRDLRDRLRGAAGRRHPARRLCRPLRAPKIPRFADRDDGFRHPHPRRDAVLWHDRDRGTPHHRAGADRSGDLDRRGVRQRNRAAGGIRAAQPANDVRQFPDVFAGTRARARGRLRVAGDRGAAGGGGEPPAPGASRSSSAPWSARSASTFATGWRNRRNTKSFRTIPRSNARRSGKCCGTIGCRWSAPSG